METSQNVSMKTSVETFIIEETQELIHDNDQLDKWNGLVAELGLTGQTKIITKDKSPIPYLYMNTALVNVFKELCSVQQDIEAYNKTPIPIDILSLVLMSKKENHFFKIQIWHNDQNPDPVCVGMAKNENFKEEYASWNTRGYNHYLIGRWADVKMSLDQLTQKAIAMFKSKEKVRLQKYILDSQRSLDNLEHEAMEKFGSALPETDNLPF